MKDRIAQVLRLPADRISSRKRLSALGLDSLMATEVLNHLRRDFDIGLSIMTLLGDNCVDDVVSTVLRNRLEA